ncbi:MAG: transporter substrate-binding domain-containing protein [Verrucomicrobiota bacterium]
MRGDGEAWGAWKMRRVGLVILLFVGILGGMSDVDAEQDVVVALSPDIPPYVMEGGTAGLEVEILRGALPGLSLRFEQMSYDHLQTAVQEGKAAMSAGVQDLDDGVFYSLDFVEFFNAAIVKKSDGIAIGKVGDLANHPVLTWEDAWRELGNEFENLFGPEGEDRDDYLEFADQEEQVRAFWEEEGAVIVIDRCIFKYFSEEMGEDLSDVEEHLIFAPVTGFKVSFRDEALRDRFDAGLRAFCASGEYAAILERHHVTWETTVCERVEEGD